MDLTQLEVFRAIAEEGSVTAAAGRLNRVPSNISTRLRQLEDELGVALFNRDKLRLHITDAGRTLQDYANRILALSEEAKAQLSGHCPAGIFTLGAIESTAAVRLPPLIARYHQAWPEVELDLSTGPSGEMTDGLLAGRFSAIFIDGPPKHPQLDGMPAFSEEMVLISSLNHPTISCAADVNGATIYAFRANCSYRRLFENWFAVDNAAPGKIFEVESYHGIVACVSAGAGLAMIPESMLQSMPGKDTVLAWRLAEARGHLHIWLVWRKGNRPANLQAMINLMEVEKHG